MYSLEHHLRHNKDHLINVANKGHVTEDSKYQTQSPRQADQLDGFNESSRKITFTHIQRLNLTFGKFNLPYEQGKFDI